MATRVDLNETPWADYSVKFLEPKVAAVDPAELRTSLVGGLTGAQWSQLRLWEEEQRCDFEDDLNYRCPDQTARGSRFCTFHERVEETYTTRLGCSGDFEDSVHESTYDQYDSWRDKEFE